MKKGLFIVLSSVLFSCGSDTDVLSPLVGDGKTHFRGSSIGDKYEKVFKRIAQDKPQQVTESVFICEFEVENVEVQTKYEFDQDQLYSIQADLFFPDTASRSKVQSALIERYNSNYGKVNLDAGFFVWNHRMDSKHEVEFTLADESIEFGQPKLSLTIYNFGY